MEHEGGDGGVPVEIVRQRFSNRIKQELAARNWNQSDLARYATDQLPDGEISRDNISNYVRQRALPGPAFLLAIAKALGTTPKDLLPERGMTPVRESTTAPAMDIRDAGGGTAYLRINRQLPWPLALQVIGLINDHDMVAVKADMEGAKQYYPLHAGDDDDA